MKAINISVSSQVVSTLPRVLIDWLLTLVGSNEYEPNPPQTVTLVPGKLNGLCVQEIQYADKQRRLFGVQPIECILRIQQCSGQYQMVLAN